MKWKQDSAGNKRKIRAYFAKYGRFPRRFTTLGNALRNYCARGCGAFDPEFAAEMRAAGFGWRGMRTKAKILEYVIEHGEPPRAGHPLYIALRFYCSRFSHDAKFREEMRAAGYGGRTSQNSSRWKDKEVICIDTGETFKSATEVANYLGVTREAVSRVCRGKGGNEGTCRGRMFRYSEDVSRYIERLVNAA